MRQRLKKRENRITLAFFLITMVVAISPLISRYCINGHDLEYHLLRIESLKEGILIGKPFSKVNALYFGGAGYASSMFYSDLLMYIPAILRVCHVSIGKSFHIYTAIIFVLCYISTFYCVWKMSLSKFAGTVAAILITLCPYHMDDMLVRTACGENTAFIFLPFAIYGIFNVLYEEMDKPWVFGLGFAGLILSHPATCIITVVFGLAAFLINVKTFTASPRTFARLCVVSGLAALVTAYHWMPMLEQFADAEFYVSNNWTDLLDSASGFADVASSTFPCVGIVLFAFALPRVFMSRRDYPILKFVDLMFVAALIFAAGATNIMPWEKVARFFGFLQFPWRLYIMSSALLAMADAVVIKLFIDRIAESDRVVAKELALILVIAVTAGMAVDHQAENSMGYYDYSDDYYSYKPFTANVIAGEWLPKTVTSSESLVDESSEMVFDDGSLAEFERKGAKIVANIDEGHEYVDVPFIFYKGYSASVTDKAGNRTKLEVSGEGRNGMCRVSLAQATGDLSVSYTGTIIQYVSLIISIVFALLIFDLWYLKNKYKKKLKMRAMAAGANLGKMACMVILAAAAFSLSGCLPADVENTARQLGQFGGYDDPDNMIDYLKNKNGTGGEDNSISEETLIKVNQSHRGYDASAPGYAVLIDESSGEQVISVITTDEAGNAYAEDVTVKEGLYGDLLKEEAEAVKGRYRSGSLKERVMHETDALLCVEVFPEKAKKYGIDALAGEFAEDITNIPQDKVSKTLDKYDCAAVLAKAAFVFPKSSWAEKATGLAEQYFKDAETSVGEEEEPVSARMWAAAELYRLTGLKTYRSVADAIAMDTIPEGFTYEEPGSYGLFAYLMSSQPTNLNVSSSMMDVTFSEANRLIKEPIENEFIDTRVDDTTKKKDEKTALRMMDEANLVTMTNYISVSVEYRDFVRDRLSFIFGANLSGTDLTEDDNVLSDAPKLFVYTGLSR